MASGAIPDPGTRTPDAGFFGQASTQLRHDVHRATVTSDSTSTGIAMGQARAHLPQSVQTASSRLIRVRPNRENRLSTAASGQSHRQKGIVTKSDPSTIPPATTYAQNVMSSPWRLIRA